MANKIKFINIYGEVGLELPTPSVEELPDWYKNIESYVGGKKKPDGAGNTSGTIKRCVPVFDAITAGYLIKSPADVYVSKLDNGMQFFEWRNFNLIKFHPTFQAPTHPAANKQDFPKWINFWGIQTPKGYSSLIVQPFHREAPFTILPGIVDTDQYTAPVNFPFVMNHTNWEGLIPKGTPIAQVIPFKREQWKMEIGSNKDIQNAKESEMVVTTKFFDGYRNKFWNRKEYR
jgi:hypothetical protein